MRTATVYNFLLEANIMAGIAVLLMVLVRKCLRRQLGNRALYVAWLLVAIRLLCPLALPNPVIGQIRSSFASDSAIRPIAGQVQVRVADASSQVSRLVSQLNDYQQTPFTKALDRFVDSNYNGMLSYRLMQAYLAGAAVVLGWFVVSNLRFRKRMQADRIEPISGRLLEQYQALCRQWGVKPLPVYYTDPLPSACLVGVWRPYIALPLTARPQEAIQVLTHEISHYKGHDQLWALLRLACCVVHWFDPLVWLAADMSRTDCELACDDRVVAGLDPEEKRAYAGVLVLAAARRNAPGVAVLATGMTMTGRRLKTRINAILHSGQVKKGLAIGFLSLATAALLCAFATAEYSGGPAIPVIAQAAISPRPLQTQEEALAYAQELCASPYLSIDASSAQWSASPVENGQAISVTALAPEWKGALELSFLPTGRMIYLRDHNCGHDQAFGINSQYGSEDGSGGEQLFQYALGFLDSLSPGASQTAVGMIPTGDGDYSNGSQRFTSFYIGNGATRYAYHFGIQLVPQVRVVSFTVDEAALADEAYAPADASAPAGASEEGAAASGAPQTMIPVSAPAGGGAAVVANQADAIAYAQELWQNPYLQGELSGAAWESEADNGMYRVTATLPNGTDYLNVHFGPDGHVYYLHNGPSRYIDALPATATLDLPAQDELGRMLLDFIESIDPGGSNRVEAFQFEGESTLGEQRYADFLALGDGEYTLLVVQLTPQRRVVCYSEGIPMDDGTGVG